MGRIGERVELRHLETTQLTEGKVMVYRAGKDVHYQAHPKEFSISLNVLVFPAEHRDQYLFDVSRAAITARASDFRSAQSLLCNVAAVLGDNRTSNVLEEVALTSRDEEVRLSAFTAWSRLDQHGAREIWELALRDRHDFVRFAARERLDGLR
jgi:hypothetical protein